MADYIAELKERVGRLVDEVLTLNEAEFVYFMSEACARRPPDPLLLKDYEEEHYFLGSAYRQFIDKEGEPERWGPWKACAVGQPDAETYGFLGSGAFLGDPDGISEWGPCEGCGTTVVAGRKAARCPVCGSAVHLT